MKYFIEVETNSQYPHEDLRNVLMDILYSLGKYGTVPKKLHIAGRLVGKVDILEDVPVKKIKGGGNAKDG